MHISNTVTAFQIVGLKLQRYWQGELNDQKFSLSSYFINIIASMSCVSQAPVLFTSRIFASHLSPSSILMVWKTLHFGKSNSMWVSKLLPTLTAYFNWLAVLNQAVNSNCNVCSVFYTFYRFTLSQLLRSNWNFFTQVSDLHEVSHMFVFYWMKVWWQGVTSIDQWCAGCKSSYCILRNW